MRRMDKFLTGIHYGAVKRKIRRVMELKFWQRNTKGKRGTYNRIKEDLKYANIGLLYFLHIIEFRSIGEYLNKVNDWIEMEAKMYGIEPTYYSIGNGKNTFYLLEIEKELAKRKNKIK